MRPLIKDIIVIGATIGILTGGSIWGYKGYKAFRREHNRQMNRQILKAIDAEIKKDVEFNGFLMDHFDTNSIWMATKDYYKGNKKAYDRVFEFLKGSYQNGIQRELENAKKMADEGYYVKAKESLYEAEN